MKQAKNTEKTNTKISKNSIPAHERTVNAGAFEDSWEGRSWSKPKLEEARLGIPLTMELLNSPDDEFPVMSSILLQLELHSLLILPLAQFYQGLGIFAALLYPFRHKLHTGARLFRGRCILLDDACQVIY